MSPAETFLGGAWIYVIFLLVAGSVLLVLVKVMATIKSGQYTQQAKQLLEAGNSPAAVELYKKAISEHLHSAAATQRLTSELTEIFRQQGIEADLSGILQASARHSEIVWMQVPVEEKAKLIVNLQHDVAAILDKHSVK
jgi:hypothetical protein